MIVLAGTEADTQTKRNRIVGTIFFIMMNLVCKGYMHVIYIQCKKCAIASIKPKKPAGQQMWGQGMAMGCEKNVIK